jgi:polyphosphate glucokinase
MTARDGGAPDAGDTADGPRVLVIDIGGSKVKMMSSVEHSWRKFPSGRRLTVGEMVERVKRMTGDWKYDAVTIGYPGPVVFGHIVGEPPNLARGWVGHDFTAAFGCPTKVTNDAVLQALGSYKGGSMLFIGLGTGVGATMIVDGVIEQVPMNGLVYKDGKGYGPYMSKEGMRRLGHEKWERNVHKAILKLKAFFEVDYVVIGGGNAWELERIPYGAVLACPNSAFYGGRRLWDIEGSMWRVPKTSTSLAAKDPIAAKP